MPYRGTSELLAEVSVTCEMCGDNYAYERTLQGAAQRNTEVAAMDAAHKILEKKVERLGAGDYGPIAISKPCPQCGYVQSWMIGPIRRQRGWQWGWIWPPLRTFFPFSSFCSWPPRTA